MDRESARKKFFGKDGKAVEIARESSYRKGYEQGYSDAFIKLFNERAKEIRDKDEYYA